MMNAAFLSILLVVFVIVIITLFQFYHAGVLFDTSHLISRANELALGTMQEAVLVLDDKLHFLNANPTFYEIFPQALEIKKGMSIAYINAWPNELRDLSLISSQGDTVEFTLTDGSQTLYFKTKVSRITLRNGKSTGWLLLIQNISTMVTMVDRLEGIAYIDYLTDIYNRRRFLEIAGREFEKARRNRQACSIILFDLDHFKVINDTYSHMAGDEILKSIANKVRTILRPYDLFARYGGEEFIIFLDTDEAKAAQMATRIMGEIGGGIYKFKDISMRCTASFGVAARCNQSPTLEMTIHNADMALYRAKTNGRNRVETYSKDKIIPEIMRTVGADCKDLQLYYQPIFSSRSMQCVGAESLLRWQSPRGEMIMPNMFIPILEKLGLMPKAEKWALNTACVQCKKWIELSHNPDFYIHVNLSAEMLTSASLYGEVISAVEHSGITPNNLVLEFKNILETWRQNEEMSLLTKLREKNVRIALDSFGYEHSPLTIFKNASVDEIKVDRSFVADIENDLGSRNAMAGIIRMVKNVDYQICMVGVETDRQKTFLQEQGVDTFQGNLFGVPVDSHEFEKKYIMR